jgi:hypothetical protein
VTVDKKIKQKNIREGTFEVSNEGKDALTKFYGVEYHQKSDTSLVLCKPFTGRTHQIRVHLQYLKFPIANDPLYSNLKVKPPETAKDTSCIKVDDSDEPERKRRKTDNFDPLCKECLHPYRKMDISEMIMYLHAWKYAGPKWKYQTKPPSWCNDFDISNLNKSLEIFESKLQEKS